MRPIDADALIDSLKNMCCASVSIKTRKIVDDALHELLPKIIDDEPTLDYAPVKHGQWIETNDDTMKRCSECDVICLIAQYPHGKANFCPNCGARMDGD